jgi:hypothetical protein
MRNIRRFLSILGLSLGSNAVAADVVVGNARLPIFEGWSVADQSDERATLRKDNGNQSITLSRMTFEATPSFDDFKRLCQLRLEAERRDAPAIVIDAGQPSAPNDAFVFFFSGGDKPNQRVFSGELKLVGNELTTVYLEGIGIDPKEHLALFSRVVESLKVAGQSPNKSLERTRER